MRGSKLRNGIPYWAFQRFDKLNTWTELLNKEAVYLNIGDRSLHDIATPINDIYWEIMFIDDYNIEDKYINSDNTHYLEYEYSNFQTPRKFKKV